MRSIQSSRLAYIPIVALILLCSVDGFAQRITYRVREITRGVNNPWEIRVGPDGWIYFTERPGKFSRVNPETGEKKVLWTPADAAWDHDAGMMGFDFHPQYPDSPYVYIATIYYPKEHYKFGVFRLTISGDSLIDRKLLYGPLSAANSHVGCRIATRDSSLYFTLGDVWWPASAGDTNIGYGKINRLKLDGKIPDDNPFKGKSAWSLGHRNPQGLDFSPDGKLYSSEHGTDVDDEVNLIHRGRNYGWPRVQGLCDSDTEQVVCDSLNVAEPMMKWSPTIAVGDVEYFEHASIPEWKNSLLLATLKDQTLYVLKLDSAGETITHTTRYTVEDSEGELLGRLRSICTSPQGDLYIGTGNGYKPEDTVDRIVELIRTGIAPEITMLDQPLNASVLEAPSTTLRWLTTFPYARYELQVAKDSLFHSESLVLKVQSTDTSVEVNSLVVGGRYYWRVREMTTGGAWSQLRYFDAVLSTVDQDKPFASGVFKVSEGKGMLRLICTSETFNVNIEVFDALGRHVHKLYLSHMPASREHLIGAVDPGTYFVRIASSVGVRTARISVR